MTSTKTPWIRLIAVLVALCAARVASAGDEAPVADLALVPRDAVGFVTLNVKELLLDDVTKEVIKEAQDGQIGGFDLKQIERVTLIVTKGSGGGAIEVPCLIVTFRTPLKRQKVLAALGSDPEKKTVGDRVYFVKAKERAVYFAGERTVVFGEPDDVAAYLGKELDITKERRFSAANQLAAEHKLLGMLDLSGSMERIQDWAPCSLKEADAVFMATSTFFTITGDQETSLTGKLTYSDAAAAKHAEKMLPIVLQQFQDKCTQKREYLSKQRQGEAIKSFPFNHVNEFLTQFCEALGKMQDTQDECELNLTITLKLSAAKLVVAHLTDCTGMTEPAPMIGDRYMKR